MIPQDLKVSYEWWFRQLKNLPEMQKTQVRSLGQEDLLEREWQPTLVFLPAKSHGQRNPEGYTQWGRKEFGHN